LQTAQPTYEEACRRAHAFASRHPALYRWRVRALITFLSFLQVYLLALMVLAPFGFPWAFRESGFLAPFYSLPLLRWLLLALVYCCWMPMSALYLAAVFRGLTLPLPAPRGFSLTEQDAPRLFRLLAETCRSLDTPTVQRVILVPDRVLQARRLPARGLVGPAQTILVAGLPLLEELSPQHLRALVAHELAHLATHNRRFGGHVLSLLARLRELRQAAESNALRRGYWGCQVDEALAGILESQWRRLGPQTLPAARQHESEADAIAAAVAGREFAAAALVRRRLAAHALSQHFRQECLQLAEAAPHPPEDLFDRRAEAARGAFSPAQIHAWLRHELDLKDDLTDSHPPLWDRLRLLGYQLENLDDFQSFLDAARPASELGETAARFFLGEVAERCRLEFFREWNERQAPDWRLRFDTYERLRRTAAQWPAAAEAAWDRYSCLSPVPTSNSGGSPERSAMLWQIAVAIGNTQSWRAARSVGQYILGFDPAHGDANLLEGQLLLEDGDAAGLEALERAMRADAAFTVPSCHLAERFLEARGDSEAAAGYKARAEERRRAEQAIAQERAHVRPTDSLCTPDCPAETVAALLHAVQQNASHIRAAYLFQKRVAGDGKRPLYVLGVERKGFVYQNSARANRLLLRRISEVHGLPGDILVCVITRANRVLLANWKAVPGGQLWPQGLHSAADSTAPAAPLPSRAIPMLREPAARPSRPVPHSPAGIK
jgi:Zn-dependent protease with chaperone function